MRENKSVGRDGFCLGDAIRCSVRLGLLWKPKCNIVFAYIPHLS